MKFDDIKILALVPMKGNSERVPNKNLKLFNGYPLYHTIINTLKKSKFIKEIIVDTDSENIIKDITISFPDVKILERPSHLCGDFISMNKIIEYDISIHEAEMYLQTHSTKPLVSAQTIDDAIYKFLESKDDYDSLFSVTKHQSRFYSSDGRPLNHDSNQLLRTQDLVPLYEENSNLYLFTRDSFSKSGNNRIGLQPKIYEIDRLEAIDIDNITDFELAQAIGKLKKST